MKNFNSASELVDLVGEFPTASKVSLIRDDTGNVVENFYAVQNDITGEICVIVSDGYQILQHEEAFMPIALEMEREEEDIFGKVDSWGGVARATVINRDITADDGSNKGLQLGFDLRNSFDKTSAFRGDAYAVRMICTNGMIAKDFFRAVGFSAKHVGDIQKIAEKELATLEDGLRNGVLKFEGVIERAQTTPIKFANSDELVLKLSRALENNKHATAITDIFYQGETDLSVYDVYNWVTDYTSNHPEKVSRNVGLTLNARAGNFLRNPLLVV